MPRGTSPAQVVRPVFGRSASARAAMISAAVWPWAAQCILFWTVTKNRCEAGRPPAELDAARRAHAVANGEDHRQAVVLEGAPDPAGALLANL